MPKKRLAMQRVYDRVVNRVIRRSGNIDWVAQGTLYPDLAESGAGLKGAEKSVIKKHHNVGNNFLCRQLLPLKDCVKQSGRNIGRAVGVSKELLMRHPFPGPGMVVRIEGVVTPEKLRIARHADEIYVGELRARDLYDDIWQAGAVVMDSMTTCNKGDGGVMGRTIELWAFDSVTGFTATPFRFPDGFLEQVAQRITDEIREVGSVSYNISGKPPRTIERG